MRSEVSDGVIKLNWTRHLGRMDNEVTLESVTPFNSLWFVLDVVRIMTCDATELIVSR